jgi:murein L,D-transpeptidase YcbB/YkuD
LRAARVDLTSASQDLRRLYGGDGAQLWSDGAAAALTARLLGADQHGLDPGPYLSLIDDSTSASARDLHLSMAALAYARALAHGLADPARIFGIYTLPRNHVDIAHELRLSLQQNRVGPWLDGLAPQDPEYLALSAAYVDVVGRSRSPTRPRIADGPTIGFGDTDGRRPDIVAALLQELPDAAPVGSVGLRWTRSDADLLKRYQRARGLREDGVLGRNSLALLNAGPHDKARRVAVNLERLRWLERKPPLTRIDVNTAASTLAYIEDGKVEWVTPVVPGRPGRETPQLQASFSRLVVNPPWYVPSSIARREILPKGPTYLRRHHMRRDGERVIQSPGPWAALGQVKFDMQDRYAIYLHDTPAKAVFDRSQRHLSHGCVRVRDAVVFARRLAEASGEGDRFDRILRSGRTGVVPLASSIPVRLIYQTALVGEGGVVTFRPDVYGWDVRTAAAIGLAPPAQDGVEPITAALLGP